MKSADKIYYNAKVITVDGEDRICEAVAILGNKLLAIGTNEEILALADEKTKKLDLGGKTIIPGLIDSHLHMAVFGMNTLALDLRSPGVGSIAEIKEKIAKVSQNLPKGMWIRGWGYDHSKLAEGRHPNRFDLDEVAPDHPVMLTRVCAHISTHNSKSLALAGIGDKDEAPVGGAYEKLDGINSGVVFENAHMNMMKVAQPSEDEIVEAMRAANKLLLSEGITSVHDSGGYGGIQMKAVQKAVAEKIIDIRMNMMIFSFIDNIDFVKDYLKIGVHTGFGDEHFQLGPIKIMIDGSSSGPTAATRRPYDSQPNFSGIMSMTQEQIDEIVLAAHESGWQMTAHAVGDKAVESMLDAYEKAQKDHSRKTARHRIEHCAMLTEGLLERVKTLGIIPVPQPIFLYEFGDGYMVNYGKKRAEVMFPCKAFLDEAVLIAGSSDCPITFSNPFLNMHLAVNRTTQSGQVVGEAQRIDRYEALKMFTINGAFASFEEDKKGSIEAGKLADLVVLEDDFLAVPDDKLRDIKVAMTIIDGKTVYKN